MWSRASKLSGGYSHKFLIDVCAMKGLKPWPYLRLNLTKVETQAVVTLRTFAVGKLDLLTVLPRET